MGVDTTKWTVQDYLDNAPAVGLLTTNFVPSSLRAQCANVAQNSVPPGAPKTFVTACTASLIIRGILYFKSSPGDCGQPTQLNLTDAQLTSISGQAAQAGIKLAGALAGAGSTIASIGGAALPGIGAAVQAITQIFANHAQAVAREQSTICSVANVINQVIPYYDNLVRKGQISPSTAYAGMQNFLNQVNAQLAAIEKSCDAACVYQGILKAHSAFVQMYWPQIAPVQVAAHAPGAPPASITAPGGVVSVGAQQPKPTAPVVGGTTLDDYFGNSETLGTAFFSSAEGTAMLPGVAGDYFSAATLANAGINPWGLNVNSVISNGQYTQIAASVKPFKAAKPKTIYPLYGEMDNGMVSILYEGKLYPVNILSGSIITPDYLFQAGVLPVGYQWGNVVWYADAAHAPYPVSTTPPSSSEWWMLAAIAAVVLVIFLMIRKG